MGLYYVLILLPRRMQDKKHRQMLENLTAGSRVVTIGGLLGTIHAIKPRTFLLEVYPEIYIEISKQAVAHPVVEEDEEEPA
jgi:preprotein translocase subunit YajC